MRGFAIAVCLLAAGCDSPAFPLIYQARARARAEEAQTVFEQAQSRCLQAIPPQVGNYVNLSKCLASARRARYSAEQKPTDLTDLLNANLEVIAGQTDRGEITEEQAKVRQAQFYSDINDRMLRRRNEARAAMPAPPPYMPMQQAPIYQAPVNSTPQRLQTTCQQIGQFTYCN